MQLIFTNRRHIVIRAEPVYQADEMQHPEYWIAYALDEAFDQSSQNPLQLEKQHG